MLTRGKGSERQMLSSMEPDARGRGIAREIKVRGEHRAAERMTLVASISCESYTKGLFLRKEGTRR